MLQTFYNHLFKFNIQTVQWPLIQLTPNNANLQGKSRKEVRVIGWWDSIWHHLLHVFSQDKPTRFAKQNIKPLKNWHKGQLDPSRMYAPQGFEMLWSIFNEARVIEGKIIKKMAWREKNHFELLVAEGSILVLVSASFELLRVRVTGS